METRITGENAMLNALKDRYQRGIYYTWAADILVALRPPDGFKKVVIPEQPLDVLKKEDSKNYHTYYFAKAIYDALLSETDEELCDQTVVLRGVSGSGKTETCKDLLSFWSLLGLHNQDLMYKINQVFVVLEAFGNSRTPCNENSTRFASTFTMYFQHNRAIGLSISQFLVDPWRIVEQTDEGSNFHSFYYALAGYQDKQVKTSYRLLKNSSGLSKQALDQYREKQHALLEAVQSLGFSAQEQSDTMLILRMILMLGNVTFKRSKYGDATLDEESRNILKASADMVGLDEEELGECLCCNTICISREEVVKSYNRDEAEDFLDFLLWTIYNRLFSWLVASINNRLSPEESSSDVLRRIHVVDFPGREVFQTNSIEQFLINISDDVLHHSFVENYSVLEEENYLSDGLEWTPRSFSENSGLINMLLLHGGFLDTIANVLREDATPPTSANLLYSDQSSRDKKYFHLDAKMPNTFKFTHYDNENVRYDIRGWSQRNKSRLPGSVVVLLKNSENALLRLLIKAKFNHRGYQQPPLTPEINRPLPKDRCASSTTHFKNTLMDFLRRFTDTSTSYVCCIRPSSSLSSSSSSRYDPVFVQKQFEGMGLKEIIYNFKNIHQMMITVEEFVEKYKDLSSTPSSSPRDKCLSILNTHLPGNGWKMGTSKIFLKQQQVARLNSTMHSKNAGFPILQVNPISSIQKQSIEVIYSRPMRPVVGKSSSNELSHRSQDPPYIESSEVKSQSEKPITESSFKRSTKSSRLYPLLDLPKPSAPFQHVTPLGAHLQKEDSESESDLETWPNTSKEKNYGEVGARTSSVVWFKKTQAKQLLQENGFYADWFHGIISRRSAEMLLLDKPKGCFLIRVAESRLGFSLSFKDAKKCRHYMIDEIYGGNFRIVGEKVDHGSLLALVEFYKKHKISNWDGYLTIPCMQSDGECDYTDLLLTTKDIQEIRQAASRPRIDPSAPIYPVPVIYKK